MTRTAILTTALLAALVALPRPARAADVSVSVSAREVFVGVPFTLQVAIDNAREREQPQLPELVGVEVVGEPSESSSSFTQIINGRMTQRETVTVSYRLVATRAGPFTIGPITVVADGQTLRTTPIRMVATVSETGDLLFLDVTSARDTYYVGETIELTLEIWLKPFHDRRTNRRLDAQEMWRQVDGRATTLGLFADRSEDITVRPALRADAEGIEREYFVYALRSRFAPRQAGLLAFDDVRVVVRYPLELQRRRSFFESGWEVSRSRPIVGTIERSAIEVLAPPREGRPPSFTGAVGTFDIEVSAKPIDVSVGDPVTLTMTITDRTPVGTKLEGLRPPDLNAVPGLSERFRIPTDPLAGVVEGRRKTFTQTIRAKDDTVTRIPPIPFAYFDPLAGRYVTVSSDPIALSVAPSANISMDDVVGFEPGNGAGPTELTEVAGGILANYSGPDLLVSQQVTAGTWVHGAAVLTPPVLFGVVAIGSRRARRLRHDHGYVRKRSARRRALRRIRAAHREAATPQAQATAQALADYVADRCNLPAGALTSAEVVDRLRQADVSPDLVADIEGLLATCEQLRYAAAAGDTDGITERATRCIDRLERERLG
ncbi:MAG: BatD family protein [Planctomycetota bacterium]|jgi:hypothetical protein